MANPLREPVLAVLAHPDDELACVGLLRRSNRPMLVYLTHGAPANPWFWLRFGSQQRYAQIRRHEACCALGMAGFDQVEFLADRDPNFVDQQLLLAIEPAISAVLELTGRYAAQTLLAPAYEGGHPDHDVCSFVAAVAGHLAAIPVWEIPLYHRGSDGSLVCQRFAALTGSEQSISLNASELELRRAMLAAYASQTDLEQYVAGDEEWFRLQLAYDYARPSSGHCNYEFWGWPMSARSLCAAFTRSQFAAAVGIAHLAASGRSR